MVASTTLIQLACLLRAASVLAQESSAPPSLTLSTAIPTATAPASSDLPSQVSLPPKQAWCPSEIFCAGQLLQTVNIAHLFPDDKTFVDKATSKSSQEVLAAFRNITNGTTYGQIVDFVEQNFAGEGRELEALSVPDFDLNPAFLKNITNPLVQAWSQIVHGYWTQLIRGTNSSTLCGSSGSNCESSLIPLNHTFVVPGGRFREQYYWDSFWIVEGLLESKLFSIVNSTLQNFMDQLDTFGFIPNGGRIYYLNRSQPPLFIQMLDRYVKVTRDKSILTRALPLAEKELTWWRDNRSLNVTSPFTNQTHLVYHYSVNNTAPRPESYLNDYMTANDPNAPALNDTQKADLYAELASGAETGWDYTIRWFKDGDNDGSLRNLGVRDLVAVDLNSILYRDHVILANLYGSSNKQQANTHRSAAADLRKAVLDLLWDNDKLAFYDFNVATNKRKNFFSAANFYPVWSGIMPDALLNDSKAAFGHFASVNLVLNRYNGTFPSSLVSTGQQWDAPNAWAPHQYVILQALRALPANVSTGSPPSSESGQSSWNLIPSGQLAMDENQLPQQPSNDGNITNTGPSADVNVRNGTVINGGNATSGEGWSDMLQRELANRYITSVFCSWVATGGSIEGMLPRLSPEMLNITNSVNNTGNMFEKFSAFDVDSAGRGGEYTVQAGFGWTNGLVLWIASNYGNKLNAPECPPILVQAGNAQMSSASLNASPVMWTVAIAMAITALL